jgi:digeranylgeranylglycerophospholipid reductase
VPTRKVDILIAGGGPAGLATAGNAALRGAKVLLVHRDAEFGRPVRTSGGTWKSDMLALGLPPYVLHEIRRVTLSSPKHQAFFEYDSDNCPVILDVSAAYQFLADRARQAGAELMTGCAYRRLLEHNGNGTLSEIEDRTSGVFEVEAAHIVDASGCPRAVLESAELGVRPPRFGVGVEYGFEQADNADDRVHLFVGDRFAPSGYGWAFPTGRGILRVGIGVIRPDTPRSPAELMQIFLESKEPERLGLKLGKLVDKHFGVIPSEGLQKKFVHGRIVTVGDAAGQALALVGEGIRFSIEAGQRLGNCLADIVCDGAQLDTLTTNYESWWNAKYRRRFTAAQLANGQFAKFRDPQWDAGTKIARRLGGNELRNILRMEFNRNEAFRWAVYGGPAIVPALARIVIQRIAGVGR